MHVVEASPLYFHCSVQSEKPELGLNPTEGAATTIWPLQGHGCVKPINRHMEADVNRQHGDRCWAGLGVCYQYMTFSKPYFRNTNMFSIDKTFYPSKEAKVPFYKSIVNLVNMSTWCFLYATSQIMSKISRQRHS